MRRLLGELLPIDSRRPLLGSLGPSISYEDLDGSRPSVAIVAPDRTPLFAGDAVGHVVPVQPRRPQAPLTRRRRTYRRSRRHGRGAHSQPRRGPGGDRRSAEVPGRRPRRAAARTSPEASPGRAAEALRPRAEGPQAVRGRALAASASAIAQPKATRLSRRWPSTTANRQSKDLALGGRLLGVVVEQPGGVAVALQHEGPVVEVPVGPEPLGEAAAPGTLLARGLVLGAGDDVLEPGEGMERAGLGKPRADEDVLIGEGEHGPAVKVAHRGVERRRSRCRPRVKAATPIKRLGVPPIRSRVAKRVTLELALLTDLGDEHPFLALLGKESHLPASTLRPRKGQPSRPVPRQ